MPPFLALFLGWLFVIYAYRTQRKRLVIAPAHLWWPTLWYMDTAGRMIGVWLDTWGVPLPGDDASGSSSFDGWIFLLMTIMGFVILSKRSFKWGPVLQANRWLTALLVFMAASIVWSHYPFVSFKRYIKIVGTVAMAMVVLTNENPLESVLTVLRRVLYVHLPMSIICVKYFRTIGCMYDWSGSSKAWQGISMSKNDLGQVAMLGVMYFAWELYRHWRQLGWKNLHTVYLLMALYLLKGSEDQISMTSVSVCILAVFVFLRVQMLRARLDAARRFVKRVFLATIAMVALIAVHSVVMFSENSLFGYIITKFGRDITLTDRTFIWHDVYAAASSHPLIGVGFGGFWIGREANIPWAAHLTWILGQAHSGYVDTYLQIGAIGETLLAIALFSTLGHLLRSLEEDFNFACFRISLLITIIFINTTESTFLRGDHHLWLIFMFVAWDVPAAVRRSVRPNAPAPRRQQRPAPQWTGAGTSDGAESFNTPRV